MKFQLFDQWNEKKKNTHKRNKIPYFKTKEIWWTQLGKNIASESLGKGANFLRPVIILQKFYGTSALVIPLTNQRKNGSYYFTFQDNRNKTQTAILPQIKYIDGRRLCYKLSQISNQTFTNLQTIIINLIKK